MRWTGADILAQLEEGWEVNEIARATGLGIAEVRRLEREERHRMRQAKQEDTVKEKVEKTRTAQGADAPHPEWEMSRIGDLARHAGVSPGTTRVRVKTASPEWLHYERHPATEHPGIAHANSEWVYRVRPGYPVRALIDEEIEQLQAELLEERGEITPAVEPWEEKKAGEDAKIVSSNDAPDALEQLAVIKAVLDESEWLPDLPTPERVERLIARSKRDHADLYAMQQALLECMEKYGVSDEGWKDAEMVDYVTATIGGVERYMEQALSAKTEQAEEVREQLVSVHRECERRGYGSDDKRPAVEKVRDIIDYVDEVLNLEARQAGKVEEQHGEIDQLREALRSAREECAKYQEGMSRIREGIEEVLVETTPENNHPTSSCLVAQVKNALTRVERRECHEADRWEVKFEQALEDAADLKREIARLEEELAEASDQLAYQKKQEKGYQNAIGELQCQVFELNDRIKDLESKRELTLEQTNTPERHDLGLIVEDWERIKSLLHNGGHPAVGSALSPTIETLLEHSAELQDLSSLGADEPTGEEPGGLLAAWLDRLANLEVEIANAYALRATGDFAAPDERCWDLEHAQRHVRRWEEVAREQDIEVGR